MLHACDGDSIQLNNLQRIILYGMGQTAMRMSSTIAAALPSGQVPAAAQHPALKVGDAVCLEGIVVDMHCIERGALLDEPSSSSSLSFDSSLQNNIEKHNCHCHLDISQCRILDIISQCSILESGHREELITTRGSGSTRLLEFHDAPPIITGTIASLGDQNTPITIKAVSVQDYSVECGDFVFLSPRRCRFMGSLGRGMKDNKLDDDDIDISNDKDDDDGDDNDNSESTKSFEEQEEEELDSELLWHASLMIISWGWVLPSGVLFARFRHRQNGLWFKIHRIMQPIGLFIAIIGWIIALVNFDVFEYKGGDDNDNNDDEDDDDDMEDKEEEQEERKAYYHGVMGCVVMIMGLMQPINAFIRPHAPQPGDPKPSSRLVWEIIHKSMGYFAITLAVATIVLGTTIVPNSTNQLKFQLGYGIGAGCALLILFVCLMVDRKTYQQ